MDIFNFFMENWDNIIAVIALGGAALFGLIKFIPKWKDMSIEEKFAYIKRLLENLYPIAISLVTEAEMTYGAGTGKIKRASVIAALYDYIPDAYKIYITEDNLEAIMEAALEEAKEIWDSNEDVQNMINAAQGAESIED